jgi:plastocyanin
MQPASRPAASIAIENFQFRPMELEIAAGGSVTWQNADDVPHTVSSRDEQRSFDSGPLDTDQAFTFRFSKPGRYDYYCKVHPHMTGTIIVK